MYDITSSGLTHSWGDDFVFTNLPDVIRPIYKGFINWLMKYFKPYRYNPPEGQQITTDRSFAVLQFNWENDDDLFATVEFRGDNNETFVSYDIHLNDLQPRDDYVVNTEHCKRGSGWFDGPLPQRWTLLLSSIGFMFSISTYIAIRLGYALMKRLCGLLGCNRKKIHVNDKKNV